MMSDQNPHPGDIRHSQIPVGFPPPPPPSGLTLIGALHLGEKSRLLFVLHKLSILHISQQTT